MEFSEFIQAHDGDDLGRLALARDRYLPAFPDFDLAITTLECRRKLRTKVPEWYAVPSLRFPFRLSAEQCSSSETARYKAQVAFLAAGPAKKAENVGATVIPDLGTDKNGQKCRMAGQGGCLADLTGGLGVDSWAFAKLFDQVLYNEMRPELAAATRHNLEELGLDNITVRNGALGLQSVSQILEDFRPDVIYLDPARRAADGRKVFRLEDCQPDVLRLLPELLAACPHLLLKLSPMADITLVCKQLGCVREVHVVAADGECKELLLLLERGHEGPYAVTVYESGAVMQLDQVQVSVDQVQGISGQRVFGPGNGLPEPGKLLFEPGKGMMKAGAFGWPCQYGLEKLGRHTHLYVGEAVPEELKPFGKTFQIVEVLPLNKLSFKELGKRYPRAEVSAHNIPLTADELRAKLGVGSGGEVHIFGAHQDQPAQNLLLVAGI